MCCISSFLYSKRDGVVAVISFCGAKVVERRFEDQSTTTLSINHGTVSFTFH